MIFFYDFLSKQTTYSTNMSGRDTVTRSELMKFGEEYSYDNTVGEIGGFHYYLKGSATPNHTMLFSANNIGEIVPVSEQITVADVQKVYTTMIDLPNVPNGTPYGWSHKFDAWVYFTAGTAVFATFKSCYV